MHKLKNAQISTGTQLGFAGFLVLVYILPPLLILAGAIPFSFRFPLLLIIAAMVLLYVLLKGNSLSSLGLRIDNLKSSLKYNLLITLLALIMIAILYFVGLIRAPSISQWRWFFIFYVLLSCPAQEFLFRGALFAEMDRAGITQKIWQVTISSVSYSFLHVIYRDAITLSVSLVIGIAWGLSYFISRNLWGVTISHCILGTASIFVGLI
jgi:hypothetical protein